MFGFLLAGVTLGLSAGFSPGPLLALVLSQTVRFGVKEGVKTAAAPLITDIPIIIVVTSFLSTIYAFKPLLGGIAIAGGLFLLRLGYENLQTRTIEDPVIDEEPGSISKGALANALNPSPYLFWVTVGGPLFVSALLQGWGHAGVFVISFYACLIGSKVALAVIVNRSRAFLKGKAYAWLMKLLGVLLILFALWLFKDGWNMLAE